MLRAYSHKWVCVLLVMGWVQVQAMEVPASGKIIIEIADVTADARGLEGISVELDGYDVGAFAAITGNQLSLNLSAPLDTGAHQLLVLAFYNNGEIDSLLEENLTVQGDSSGSWSHAITLDNSYRSVSHEKADFADEAHYRSNGGAVMQGTISHENWELKANLETLYDSNQSNNPSQEEFDLSHYKIEAAYQGDDSRAFMRVGDDTIDQENLLFSAYQRRGISGGVKSNDGTYDAKIFGFQSDPSTSPDNHLAYASHREERSTGGVVSYAPLANKEALKISAGYLEGEGTSSGTGFQSFDEDTIYGGDSWNLGIDSRLLGGAFLLRSEYAWSNFDSDGIDVGSGHESDNAWSATAEYSVEYDANRWLFDQWTIGARVQEVGAKYWSIGNLGLPGDLHQEKIYYQGNRGGFGLTAEVIQEVNNVDNSALVADQTSDFYNLDFYYSPMNINPKSGVWKTLGMPSFNGYTHFARRDQPKSDAFISGYNLDNFTSEYGLGASFSKEHWSWSIQHSQILFDERADALVENGFTIYEPLSDSVNYLTSVMVSYMPSERMTLTPMVQWSLLNEDETNNDYESVHFGFDGQYQIIPKKWLISLNYSINQNDSTYGDSLNVDTRLRDQTLNLQSTWKVSQAKGISPGVDLYLKSGYGRQQELKVDNGEEIYQVLVGFTLYWNKEGN